MTANFIAKFCRAFNVYRIAFDQFTQIRDTQRLFHQIKANTITVNLRYRQTATVVRNRCTCFQPVEHRVRQLHNMGTEIGFLINRHQFCCALHDTSKHAYHSFFIRTALTPFNRITITAGKTGCQWSAFPGDFFTR
ncbi:hypothetical protein D3C78_1390460 [compost metagenome]